jgi:hypothetical protein
MSGTNLQITPSETDSDYYDFFHPDYTVGYGITPYRGLIKDLADFTAGGELHPAPKFIANIPPSAPRKQDNIWKKKQPFVYKRLRPLRNKPGLYLPFKATTACSTA